MDENGMNGVRVLMSNDHMIASTGNLVQQIKKHKHNEERDWMQCFRSQCESTTELLNANSGHRDASRSRHEDKKANEHETMQRVKHSLNY